MWQVLRMKIPPCPASLVYHAPKAVRVLFKTHVIPVYVGPTQALASKETGYLIMPTMTEMVNVRDFTLEKDDEIWACPCDGNEADIHMIIMPATGP